MPSLTLPVEEKVPTAPVGVTVVDTKITSPRGDTEGHEFEVFWVRNHEPYVKGYNVYRAESANGVLVRANQELIEDIRFVDKGLRHHQNVAYYYAVTAVSDYGESELSTLATPVATSKPDPVLLEIVRRHFILLDKDGEYVDLFIRKQTGERCKSCFDPIRLAPTRERCLDCFGTTFEGGYDGPTRIKVRLVMATQQFNLQGLGFLPTSTPIMWTTAEPKLHDWDVIVTDDNRRFQLQNVARSPVRGIVLHQRCQLDLRPDTDMIYLLGKKSLKVTVPSETLTKPPDTKEVVEGDERKEIFPDSINTDITKKRYVF